MALDTNLSILFSAVLAVAWSKCSTGPAEEVPKAISKFVMAIRSANQVLPAILVFVAASSWSSVLTAALTFGLMDSGSWLGSGDLCLWRRWALLTAVAIWRAEKFESLLQRMQRSVGVLQQTGFSEVLRKAGQDGTGWVWAPVWAIARRVALITVSSFGCTPFVSKVLPAVVMDEFLWWALAQFQGMLGKAGISTHAVFDTIVFPLLDVAHFLPVLIRVFLLGAIDYQTFRTTPFCQAVLAMSAFCWTGHNCHSLYSTLFQDLPESARQLWAYRSGIM